MVVSERDLYVIKRRSKKITCTEIAKAIGCTASLLCQYERRTCEIAQEKIRRYRNYIDSAE